MPPQAGAGCSSIRFATTCSGSRKPTPSATASKMAVSAHISGGTTLPEPNPEHLKAVVNAINTGPFFKHMSMKVTEIGVGYSVVLMKDVVDYVGSSKLPPKFLES